MRAAISCVPRLRAYSLSDSPLISHKWSEKAKKQMLDKQMKKAKAAKEAKNPEQDFKDSLYVLPDGTFGFPIIGFKAAAVTACTSIGGITKVAARQAFHVEGEFARIEGGDPTMREDMVRVGMGTADLRYRPGFPSWSVDLPVRFNPNAIALEQLVHLFNQAGFSCGVGEWRPQKDGPYGMFHVEGVTER